jgi:hypothetical protein
MCISKYRAVAGSRSFAAWNFTTISHRLAAQIQLAVPTRKNRDGFT